MADDLAWPTAGGAPGATAAPHRRGTADASEFAGVEGDLQPLDGVGSPHAVDRDDTQAALQRLDGGLVPLARDRDAEGPLQGEVAEPAARAVHVEMLAVVL